MIDTIRLLRFLLGYCAKVQLGFRLIIVIYSFIKFRNWAFIFLCTEWLLSYTAPCSVNTIFSLHMDTTMPYTTWEEWGVRDTADRKDNMLCCMHSILLKLIPTYNLKCKNDRQHGFFFTPLRH